MLDGTVLIPYGCHVKGVIRQPVQATGEENGLAIKIIYGEKAAL